MERLVKCRECGFQMTIEGPQFHVMSKIRIHREKHNSIKVNRP